MQRLLNLKLKTIIWIYVLSILINIVGGNSLLYFSYENFIFPLFQKISEHLVNKTVEENIDITLVKGGMLEASKEEFLISSKDFPIDVPKENLLYISNQANLETLKSKNSLIALSNNKIFSELDGEYLVIDIWEQFPGIDRISINVDSLNSIKNWLNDNKNLQVLILLGVSSISTLISLGIYFLVGFFIVRFVVSFLFKVSKTVYSDLNLKVTSVIFLAIYNILEPILKVLSVTFSLPFPDILTFSFIGILFLLIFSTKFPKLVS